MTKYYEIDCLKQDRRLIFEDDKEIKYSFQREYGFQLPGILPCPSHHIPYHDLFRWENTDLPFSCPDEIIEDVEHLISTVPSSKRYYHPTFPAKILYPYLLKWSRFLIDKNYRLDTVLGPGTTFSPDILFVFPKFVDGDFVQLNESTGPFSFVSQRLKDALANCRGVYYREVVMPDRTAPHQYFRMLPDHFLGTRLFMYRSICWEETIKDKGMACQKCGERITSKKTDKLITAKYNYCYRKKILPSHLIIPDIDIFVNFSMPRKFFFSEKAYSILKHFEIPDLKATEYEVKDDPLWFDDVYWYNYGIEEYGETC